MKKEKYKQNVSAILFSSLSLINFYLAFARQDDGTVNILFGVVFGLGALIIIADSYFGR